MSRFKGAISIGLYVDEKTGQIIIGSPERCVSLNPEEEKAVGIIYGFLSSCVDMSLVRLDKRSDDYTSVVYGRFNDFLRFKFTNRTKWLSIRLPLEFQLLNIDNPLFDAQNNKRQLHWKAKLKSIDELSLFKDFIIASCIDI